MTKRLPIYLTEEETREVLYWGLMTETGATVDGEVVGAFEDLREAFRELDAS